jgi:hypothetical protein
VTRDDDNAIAVDAMINTLVCFEGEEEDTKADDGMRLS